MDPQNQQPSQQADINTPQLKVDTNSGILSSDMPSPVYMEPLVPKKDKKPFYRRTPVIFLSAILLLILASITYSFIVNKVNEYVASNQKDSDILVRIEKKYPGVFSTVEVTEKTKEQNCTLFCGTNKEDYRYRGYIKSKNARFKMSFDILISTTGKDDSINVDIYDILTDARLSDFGSVNRTITQNEWDKFVSAYNSTGEDILGYMGGMDFKWQNVDGQIDTSGILLAGYSYNNLYKVCPSYDICDTSGDDGTIKSEKDYLKGFYIFYYDEQKSEWIKVTDNGQYLIDWIYQQGKKNLTMSQINWEASPIKVYK